MAIGGRVALTTPPKIGSYSFIQAESIPVHMFAVVDHSLIVSTFLSLWNEKKYYFSWHWKVKREK